MPPVLCKIIRANHDGSVKSTDNLYEAGLDPYLVYIISNVVSNIKFNPLQRKGRIKKELNILVLSVQKMCVITKELFNLMNAIVGLMLLVIGYQS